MTINFKKPKYVIPLIGLPFIFIFYFIARGYSPKKSETQNEKIARAATPQGVNPTLPGVSKNVADQSLADKFAAYQQALKHQTDYSVLGNIPDSENSTTTGSGLNYTSSYTPGQIQELEAQRRLDSLQKTLEHQSENIKNHRSPSGGSPYSSTDSQTETPEQIMARVRKIKAQYDQKYGLSDNGNSVADNNPAVSSQSNASNTNDLGEFREKMHIIDSMQQAATGNNPPGSLKHKNRFDPDTDSTFHPMNVSLNKPVDNNFNTIRPFSADKSIKAIIDENEKVFAESRVRIKLLDNIYVGGNLIPKRTYLYAMVTGFQMHRINLTITSIMYNDNPLPVDLDVYDQDGYLGLYVPESNFREFSKEIGTSGTNGLSEIQIAGNQSLKANLLQQLFQTSGSAITNYINKDKAFVKYNYVIYLIENKNHH